MLRNKLFLAFTILVLIFGILSSFIGVNIIKNRVVAEAQTRVRLDLNSAWSVHNGKLHEIETVLKLAAGKKSVIEMMTEDTWPNQEVQNRFEKIRLTAGLDFLTIVSADGMVIMRTAPPYSYGDYKLSNSAVAKSLKGEVVSCTALFTRYEMEQEQQGMAEKAFIIFEDTPHARLTLKNAETRGMVMLGAVPIRDNNRIVGAVYGGTLLNRNNKLVDEITNIVFESEKDKKIGGTVTIFLNDSRIATTVRMPNGNRATGTRVSKEVADRVLDNGKRWEGKAFVVNDWYLTAYEPMYDCAKNVIGIMYVGILEKPYSDLTKNILFKYAGISFFGILVALIFAFIFAGRLARPLHSLSEAAQRMHNGESPGPVKSNNASKETENLIDAFNKMMEALTEREVKLKEVNDKLEEANTNLLNTNKNYMETLGFISHELKSPLSTIMNYVYLIKEKKVGPLTEKQMRGMVNIDNNVKRLVEMVRHYLNLSRIENGELEPVKSKVAVYKEVIKPLISSYEAEAEERKMTFLNKVGEDLFLETDLNMTREVFENLISNAVKYGRECSVIKIDAAPGEEFTLFSIFNEGEGVPEEKMEMLFNKFTRIEDNCSARTKKGTGLGLFITKRIIEAHGGSIEVESIFHEWVNFKFTLPVYKV